MLSSELGFDTVDSFRSIGAFNLKLLKMSREYCHLADSAHDNEGENQELDLL